MHRKILLTLIALCLGTVLFAQTPLIDSTHMPNAVRFLPAPPEKGSAAFDYDQAQYRWGLEQRKDSARLAMAVGDAVWSVDNICRIFGETLGITLSEANTPAIYKMLVTGLLTTDQAGKMPKNHYMRTRPYVFYDEPTIYPGDEAWLRTNGSYPSGHTILGWSAALLLTEVAPDRSDVILARGFEYGQSRVIAGYHWQSDVDAGRLVASAAVARLHADKRFLKLMKKARKEYRKLTR